MVSSYLALFVYMVYLLLMSRTPTTAPLWAVFNPAYLGVYFVMTLLLLALIAKKGNSNLRLGLLILHCIVSHIFWVALYETRMGFDYWIGGWVSRGAYSGEVPQWNIFTASAPLVRIFHFSQMVLSPYMSALSARMFFIDVYWTHLLFMPLIWGVFVPIVAYSVSKMLCKDERTALTVALLTMIIPSFISWGSRTVSNSFSILLYFFTIYLMLRYLSGKGNIILIGFFAALALLEHALVGVISFSVVIILFFYKKYLIEKTARLNRSKFLLVFLLSILLLPISLYVRRWTTYPEIGGTPSLQPLLRLPGYDAFLLLIFGDYASMKFSEAFVSGIVPLIGLIGLIYVAFNKSEPAFNKKMSRFLLLIFVLILIEYEITKCFMINIPFSPERIWALRDFLAILFFPVALGKVGGFLLKEEAKLEAVKHKINLSRAREFFVKGIVMLSVAALTTAVLFTAYPNTTVVLVTGYELEAVKFIEATTNETYIVIAQEYVTWAGSSLVGLANPRAFYSPAYSPPPGYAPRVPTKGNGSLLELYNKMLEDPSLLYIYRARQITNASIVYTILTKSYIKKLGLDAEWIIASMEELPFTEKVGFENGFGNDTYVFASKPPAKPVLSGEGPSVYVYNTGTYVNTTYSYDLTTATTTYALVLRNSSTYNITSWPIYWSFESITPYSTAQQIDANTWINFTGTPDQTYRVLWSADERYNSIGWRDDSFTSGWTKWIQGGWEGRNPPEMSTDGDILTLQGEFVLNKYSYYYISTVVNNVSTDTYPFLIMKWMSTNKVAYGEVSYADGSKERILYWGSYSPNWDLKVFKLRSGTVVKEIIIGLSNLGKEKDVSGTQSFLCDYIFLANKT